MVAHHGGMHPGTSDHPSKKGMAGLFHFVFKTMLFVQEITQFLRVCLQCPKASYNEFISFSTFLVLLPYLLVECEAGRTEK